MTENINLKFNALIMRRRFETDNDTNGVNRMLDKNANNGIWAESNAVYDLSPYFLNRSGFALFLPMETNRLSADFVYSTSISSGLIYSEWKNNGTVDEIIDCNANIRVHIQKMAAIQQFVCKLLRL